MKIKELIKILQKYDQEREVICQSDGEGNAYFPLNHVWVGAYKDGEAGLDHLTKNEIDMGYRKENVIRGGSKAIFLVPKQ